MKKKYFLVITCFLILFFFNFKILAEKEEDKNLSTKSSMSITYTKDSPPSEEEDSEETVIQAFSTDENLTADSIDDLISESYKKSLIQESNIYNFNIFDKVLRITSIIAVFSFFFLVLIKIIKFFS